MLEKHLNPPDNPDWMRARIKETEDYLKQELVPENLRRDLREPNEDELRMLESTKAAIRAYVSELFAIDKEDIPTQDMNLLVATGECRDYINDQFGGGCADRSLMTAIFAEESLTNETMYPIICIHEMLHLLSHEMQPKVDTATNAITIQRGHIRIFTSPYDTSVLQRSGEWIEEALVSYATPLIAARYFSHEIQERLDPPDTFRNNVRRLEREAYHLFATLIQRLYPESFAKTKDIYIEGIEYHLTGESQRGLFTSNSGFISESMHRAMQFSKAINDEEDTSTDYHEQLQKLISYFREELERLPKSE